MLIPRFSLDRGERLYITGDLISNGHWLIKRHAALVAMAPKPLASLLSLREGKYFDGISGGLSTEDTMDLAQVIPKREGYERLEGPQAVQFRNGDGIGAYIYQGRDFKIGVEPNYTPLLRMGYAFAKGPREPILVLDDETLNGELLAVVMPIRIEGEDA